MATRRRYLVAYDISDPARLRAVHKKAKAYGYALQYSVFICDLTDAELVRAKWAFSDVIHHREDRLVFVDLGDVGSSAKMEFMGRQDQIREQRATII